MSTYDDIKYKLAQHIGGDDYDDDPYLYNQRSHNILRESGVYDLLKQHNLTVNQKRNTKMFNREIELIEHVAKHIGGEYYHDQPDYYLDRAKELVETCQLMNKQPKRVINISDRIETRGQARYAYVENLIDGTLEVYRYNEIKEKWDLYRHLPSVIPAE